jgi:Flp pilus assembly protein TadD
MADRYAYIPLIGIFVVVVWGLADLADVRAVPISWRTTGTAVVLVILSCLTWLQIGYWRSSYDLWTHALAVTKDNHVAEENMGTTLQDLGRWEEALPHFRNGARINSKEPVVHINLAATLAQTGRLQEAIPEYETTIQLASQNSTVLAAAYADLGTVYRHLGDYAQAHQNYMKSLQINPEQTSAREGLSKLVDVSGSHQEARQ